MTEWFSRAYHQEFAHGRVRIVEPRIVIEVTFDRCSHQTGTRALCPALSAHRAPAPDKTVDEIDTLESVRSWQAASLALLSLLVRWRLCRLMCGNALPFPEDANLPKETAPLPTPERSLEQ